MGEAAFEGLQVFFRTWGQGEALVLLHCGGSSSAQWDNIADRLAADFRLIAPDLPGFGATPMWPKLGELTHDLQARLVEDVIRASGGGPAHLVGHSYGGSTALRLALRTPELVRSLILIEPIPYWLLKDAGDPLYDESQRVAKAFIGHVDAGRPHDAWEMFIDSRSGAGTWARMSESSRGRFLSRAIQTREGFISNMNNRTTLAECRTLGLPSTIVCGSETTPQDRRTTEILRDAMTSRYRLVAGAGHMSPFTHPDAIAGIVRDHLRQLGQSR
jgi:pimeloyl-ACP methyl ester carboxylesterase